MRSAAAFFILFILFLSGCSSKQEATGVPAEYAIFKDYEKVIGASPKNADRALIEITILSIRQDSICPLQEEVCSIDPYPIDIGRVRIDSIIDYEPYSVNALADSPGIGGDTSSTTPGNRGMDLERKDRAFSLLQQGDEVDALFVLTSRPVKVVHANSSQLGNGQENIQSFSSGKIKEFKPLPMHNGIYIFTTKIGVPFEKNLPGFKEGNTILAEALYDGMLYVHEYSIVDYCGKLFSEINKSFGSYCGNSYNSLADLNEDGFVNILDFSLLSGNYNPDWCRNRINKPGTGCSLKSRFLKEDQTALSIMNGTRYALIENNLIPYYENGTPRFNSSSFEYKIISSLRQLGFVRLGFTERGSNAASADLQRFQRRNNLTVGDNIDIRTLMLIDKALFEKELSDRESALRYGPFSLFVESKPTEPLREHLGSIYHGFFTAIKDLPDSVISIDDLRVSLVTWLGRNLGVMMDAEGKRELSIGEAVVIMQTKGNFAFCSPAYYARGCLDLSEMTSSIPLSDFEYMNTVTHEFGHVAGKRYAEIKGVNSTLNFHFASISFNISSSDPYSIFLSLQRPDNDFEFVSSYAKSSSYEDFAESFNAYIQEGRIFRRLAESDTRLMRKYNFLKDNVFRGVEFDTGELRSLELWNHDSKGLPGSPSSYMVEDPYWTWDYGYKTLN
ncbi:hypothetical protein HYU11_01915 [Candidatus Woesearchaeota archaeon]|nr:hypothetical protein [Candidatus Woesearchaeota archaeon]